jgi:hypothetical protein
MFPFAECMNIYIYARVSTDRQQHDSQLNELRDYCARRGWVVREEIVDSIYPWPCTASSSLA